MNNMYRVGAAASLFFISAQIFQRWVFTEIPLGSEPATQLANLGSDLHVFRSGAILLSLFFLTIPFAVIAYQMNHSVIRMLVMVFFAFFVGFEIGYRSVELFVIQLHWSDDADSAATVTRFLLFDQVVTAMYFPLLASHGIASGLAAWAVPFRGSDRWLKFALGWNAVRLALRTIGMFGGVAWMNWLTGKNYFISILVVFIPMTVWFFLKSRETKLENKLIERPV